MITRSIKYYFMAGTVCCGLTAALTACSEWDDHYEDPVSVAGAESTLWQTIQQRSDLSDFREVLSKTMVIKHHQKTDVSYADMLDGNQTFTVLAPVNGSFNKDSVLRLLETSKGDSMVVRSFVGNHLLNSLTNNSSTPVESFLLNTKRVTIGNNQALNVPFRESNIKARGGLLHVLEQTLPYRSNLYEVMVNDPRYQQIGEQLSSYGKDEFDPKQSIEGEMIDGEQQYIDSVFIEHNTLLERMRGLLADEDSSYIFLAPVADEWQRVWNEAMGYYRFDSTVENGDSLQRFWANYALLNDAIFSRTIQSSPADSLITFEYNKRYPKYHVFHRPFDEGGILYGATPTDYSNGTLYTTEKWPYTPQTTYQREVKSEGEATRLILENTLSTYNTRIHAADSVSENEYLVITAAGLNSNWTIKFKLENTLAGTYDVCAVVLPATVYNPSAQLKPNMFQAEIGYVDEKGDPKTYDCQKTRFQTDPARVDTVVLAEDFVLPVCNYGQTNSKFTVKLTCSILPRENARFSREMFLDCIYLRPKKNKTTD